MTKTLTYVSIRQELRYIIITLLNYDIIHNYGILGKQFGLQLKLIIALFHLGGPGQQYEKI